ncbi:MAG: phage scaffolding protein [Clostridia bacterium]|nr:phage scaffolding protein [Clostridia bacterium]
MKKEELVKLGLDEETAEKVANASAEELKGFVPKSRFDEVNNAKKTAEDTVKERDQQIESLKSAGNVDDLKQQITTLQNENKAKDEAHAAELLKVRIDSDVEAALTEAKAKNHKAVKALLDLEKAELGDDGKVKGLREQIAALTKAEDSKFMFNAVTAPKMKGAKTGEDGIEDGDKGVDTSKMTYDELCAYLAENPEATLS